MTALSSEIRSAMQDRDQNYMVEGLIEMDEAYLGAPKRGKKRGRGTERKKMAVAVARQRAEDLTKRANVMTRVAGGSTPKSKASTSKKK